MAASSLPVFHTDAPLALLFGVAMRNWQWRHWQPLAYGLLRDRTGLFLDLFLFKNTTVNAVWWLYAVGVARLTDLREKTYAPDRCC